MSVAKPVLRGAAKSAGVRPWDFFGLAAFLTIAVEFYMALVWAPVDVNQGEPYRIVYLHVPMIMVSYVAFTIVFVSSILFLWRRRPVSDIVARSAAEVGLLFLSLVILSGGLWGQATFGRFWQWEPRLTFTFIQWLIFLSYVMLRNAAENKERMARYCAVVGILGFADIPLIYSSVYLFRGMHPPISSVSNPPAEIGITLLVGVVGFMMAFFYLLSLRYRIDRTQARVEELFADAQEASR